MYCAQVFNCANQSQLSPYSLLSSLAVVKPMMNLLAFGLPGESFRKKEAAQLKQKVLSMLPAIGHQLSRVDLEADVLILADFTNKAEFTSQIHDKVMTQPGKFIMLCGREYRPYRWPSVSQDQKELVSYLLDVVEVLEYSSDPQDGSPKLLLRNTGRLGDSIGKAVWVAAPPHQHRRLKLTAADSPLGIFLGLVSPVAKLLREAGEGTLDASLQNLLHILEYETMFGPAAYGEGTGVACAPTMKAAGMLYGMAVETSVGTPAVQTMPSMKAACTPTTSIAATTSSMSALGMPANGDTGVAAYGAPPVAGVPACATAGTLAYGAASMPVYGGAGMPPYGAPGIPDLPPLPSFPEAVEKFLEETRYLVGDLSACSLGGGGVLQPLLDQAAEEPGFVVKLEDEFANSKTGTCLRVGFMAFASYTVFSDLRSCMMAIHGASSILGGVGQCLINISRSGNMGALASAFGLHAIFADEDMAMRPILGDFEKYTTFFESISFVQKINESEVVELPTELSVGGWGYQRKTKKNPRLSKVTALIGIVVVTLYGLIWGSMIDGFHWDPDALRRMPFTQRIYIKGLWMIYKPFYHTLLVISSAALFAYVALVIPVLLIILMIGCILAFVILPAVLKLRKSAEAEKDEAQKWWQQHISQWYLFVISPMLSIFLLSFMVPVALRFYCGLGWIGSLRATWDDRHMSGYFKHLSNSTDMAVTVVWNAL